MVKDPPRFKPRKEVVVPLFVPLPAIKQAIIDNPVIPLETDEERWSREYDEENDPDPWSDLDVPDCEDPGWDQVEDWELLGMDGDESQEEIDAMWENQM